MRKLMFTLIAFAALSVTLPPPAQAIACPLCPECPKCSSMLFSAQVVAGELVSTLENEEEVPVRTLLPLLRELQSILDRLQCGGIAVTPPPQPIACPVCPTCTPCPPPPKIVAEAVDQLLDILARVEITIDRERLQPQVDVLQEWLRESSSP